MSIVADTVKLLSAMPASHARVLVQVPAALFPVRLPVTIPGEQWKMTQVFVP